MSHFLQVFSLLLVFNILIKLKYILGDKECFMGPSELMDAIRNALQDPKSFDQQSRNVDKSQNKSDDKVEMRQKMP